MKSNNLRENIEHYLAVKKEIERLSNMLYEWEEIIKNSGIDKIEIDNIKVSVYEVKPKRMFSLAKFKELNPNINFTKEEYYIYSKPSKALKITETKK